MTTSSPSALVIHNLSKIVTTTDSSLTLLQQINLQVLQGDSLAIVGSSGSGKSTLLGLLAGLDVATEGSIRLFGHDLTQLDEDERAALRQRYVGFVFQS